MQDSTRRSFLAVAGTSAVAGVALTVAPDVASAAVPASTEPATLPAHAEPALTAYIRDTARGEVLIMSEGREVTVTDRALVARLAHAFAAAKKG